MGTSVMAKQPKTRKRAANSKSTGRRRAPAKSAKAPQKRPASTRKRKRAASATRNAAAETRRQSYLEAIGLYERALEALQRRDLAVAAARFQQVIDRFPEELELHERCRLYLQVCERQSKPPPAPKTLEERIFAATLALNAGAQDEALQHLEAAMTQDPDSDQVQYMLALARAASGKPSTAVSHLKRAIELNPDNRFLARQEPSFEPLQEDAAFQRAVRTPPAPPTRGAARRSSR